MHTIRKTHTRKIGFAVLIVLTLLALIMTTALAAGDNSITSPDTAGNVGDYSSLALDSNGNPVISYLDYDSLSFKIMHCNEPNCAGGDESITAPTADKVFLGFLDVELDGSGNPVVSYTYYDDSDPSNLIVAIKLMHCNDPNCAGGDESITTAANVDSFLVGFVSLALDSSGYPVVSYATVSESSFSIHNLTVLHCNDVDCSGGDESIEIVDVMPNASSTFYETALALDSSDNPVVSYLDDGSTDLKLLHCNDPNCAGGDESINVLENGHINDMALVLDGGGNPVVTYGKGDNLYIQHCNDPNCGGGDESIGIIDDSSPIGLVPSLALDSSGNPVVSSYDRTNADLKIVYCNDVNCLGGDESITVPDGDDSVGTYSSLALDGSGYPVVSYYDHTNGDLKLLHCGNPTCAESNTAPTANSGGPYLGVVNTSIQFDGSASSDPDGDSLTYAWDFGDENSGTGTMPTHSYSETSIYDVCLTANDSTVDSDPACTIAVVYDPSAGFVTGGGWIDSPAGAYTADPSLTGKATFGFVSKYKKGASVPSGNTSFAFDLAGLDFYSDSYEWLVVNGGGTNAQFKGEGTVNDGLDPNGNPYKFMLWAGDDSPDTFRIRIWWEDASGVETVVYDNGTDQPIGAGNIVVHKHKK